VALVGILVEMGKETYRWPVGRIKFQRLATLRLRLAFQRVRATRNFITPDCDLRHTPMFAQRATVAEAHFRR
jgi:hypothetical protein